MVLLACGGPGPEIFLVPAGVALLAALVVATLVARTLIRGAGSTARGTTSVQARASDPGLGRVDLLFALVDGLLLASVAWYLLVANFDSQLQDAFRSVAPGLGGGLSYLSLFLTLAGAVSLLGLALRTSTPPAAKRVFKPLLAIGAGCLLSVTLLVVGIGFAFQGFDDVLAFAAGGLAIGAAGAALGLVGGRAIARLYARAMRLLGQQRVAVLPDAVSI
jgi:hypothetical protein